MHQILHENIKSIIVISTMVKGVRHFVAKDFTPCECGKKVIISLTTSADEAKSFMHRGLAMDFIVIIKNPQGRAFTWDYAVTNKPPQKLIVMRTAREVLSKVS